MVIITEDTSKLIIQTYEGEKDADNAFIGEGVATYISGHKYAGTFKNGLLDGNGRYEWYDGVIYEGEFSKNRIHGIGSFLWYFFFYSYLAFILMDLCIF